MIRFNQFEVYMNDKVEKVNNGIGLTDKSADAKILEKAYQEYAKDMNLTKAERITLEKMDDILKKADIVINESGLSAQIAQGGEIDKLKASTKIPLEMRSYAFAYDVDHSAEANVDAKILAKAYQVFLEDGIIDASEKVTIEKLDELLAKADITIGENGEDVSIIQPDGTSFYSKVISDPTKSR